MRILINRSMLMIAAASSTAAAQIPVQRIGAPPFTEVTSRVVKTAGGELLGLVGGDLDVPANGVDLVVGGLMPSDRTICVTIRHVGGSYSANFSVPRASSGGMLHFVLPANRIAGLRATRGELAVLARASTAESCGRADPVLPAAWGVTPNFQTVRALVNDHQALRTQIVANGIAPTRCTRLAAPVLTAYQMACDTDLRGTCGTTTLAVQFIDATAQSTLRTQVRRVC